MGTHLSFTIVFNSPPKLHSSSKAQNLPSQRQRKRKIPKGQPASSTGIVWSFSFLQVSIEKSRFEQKHKTLEKRDKKIAESIWICESGIKRGDFSGLGRNLGFSDLARMKGGEKKMNY